MANETVFNVGKKKFTDGSINWTSSTIKMLLLSATAAGAFNPDVATVAALLAVGSVTESTATGYARTALGSLTSTQDDTNDRANLDSADVSFGAIGSAGGGDSVVAAVVYLDGGSDATRYPISYHGFATQALNGGTFSVTTPSDVVRLT